MRDTVLTDKNQPKEKKEIFYPSVEELIRINKVVLGDKQALNELPESTRKNIEEMNAHLKPRPLERIPAILDALKQLWTLVPDQRLGQLLLNYIFREADHRDQTSIEMYAQEDDETLSAIKANITRRVKESEADKNLSTSLS